MDGLEVHEIGADEAGESKWAFDALLCRLGNAEQQVGDQGYGQLDAHSVLAGAEELLDPQRLLDPAEEQLDLPSKRSLAPPRRVL